MAIEIMQWTEISKMYLHTPKLLDPKDCVLNILDCFASLSLT